MGVSRGKLLAAAVVLSRPEACRSPDLSGTQGASRQAFLVCLEWPSRQAPLAGVLSLPGKILLPGPWLAFPASSSYRGLGLSTLFLNGLQGNHGGSWRSPSKPCRGMLRLPVHKFGILRYPYFSTPTLWPQQPCPLAARPPALQQATTRYAPSRHPYHRLWVSSHPRRHAHRSRLLIATRCRWCGATATNHAESSVASQPQSATLAESSTNARIMG